MQLHGRAKLGLAGRLALTQAVMDGMTLKQAVAYFFHVLSGRISRHPISNQQLVPSGSERGGGSELRFDLERRSQADRR
jgi:hypothetical protein